MRFGGWICSCALAAAVLVSQIGYAQCVPKAEMQVIAQHFKQLANLAGKDFCYDGSQMSNLIQAIEFMRRTPFEKSMPKSADELFSGTFANDWYGYFTGRIDEFQVEKSCPKGVGAFVYFYANIMHVCPLLLTDNFTALDRTSVMMHEARHIDGFPHIMCTHGARAGMNGACDQLLSDKGSYAVTVETYAQLGAYATDLHPALRAYARASAIIYADEAFATPVKINRTPQFLLMTTNREFYRLKDDGSTQLDRWGSSPALGHIVMRARHMILYPDDKSLPAKYVFAHNEGDIQQGAGDLAVAYNAETPQQRGDLVDVHMGAQWSARIFHSRVRLMCDPTSDATQDLPMNGQTAVSAIYPTGYDRAVYSAQLITESGAVMEFGCENRVPFLRATTLSFDQNYKRVQKAGNLVLGLTGDGRLFQLNGATSTPLQTSADGRIFDLVPNEDFLFFDVTGV